MSIHHHSLLIEAGKVRLEGTLNLPNHTYSDRPINGLILFIHGSGSSRFSPRNQLVAQRLNQAGLATILFDLLTESEGKLDEVTQEYRFNISLLTQRTVAVIDWLQTHSPIDTLHLGLFGASTGAAAALNAARLRPNEVECVVSRGGRPDLAMLSLPQVKAPTLLMVGSLDTQILALNKRALTALPNNKHHKLSIIEGASHLFEEDNTLMQAANEACDWFLRYLKPSKVTK
ncbi:dienelactone hydrolase family protein [Thiomicrorhabdus aquaedulcis]|uniref:dienelactone hydrolase family protein n=1 Tax=Thiomicrorhabdus aquaedulcis TaxID=2211106 RepID=UPI000FDAB3FF|nr:alpha/beta fold hydrolase [Thiomicrorhabdus aquaedulcis]